MKRPPSWNPVHRQKGAALLAAMLTVTLVATLAAAALWQQWRAVEVEAAERSRVQSGWILTGALDWSRLILREDGRTGGTDHLAEPWAVGLNEARMSSFLAADKNASDVERDAFLSGQITDLQARLNVASLVEGNIVSPAVLASFQRLFDLLGLAPAELPLLANGMLQASLGGNQAPAGQAPLLPERVEQLVWLGVSRDTLAVLKPYITVLPSVTPVNLNTASAEVIYASTPGLEMADAQKLVAARQRSHLRSLSDAAERLGGERDLFSEGQHAVGSRFFEVRGRLRLDQRVVEERSVVQREGQLVRTLWRDRGALSGGPGVVTER